MRWGEFATFNMDFADCALAAASAATGLPVVTYDLDYRRFTDVVAETTQRIASLTRQARPCPADPSLNRDSSGVQPEIDLALEAVHPLGDDADFLAEFQAPL